MSEMNVTGNHGNPNAQLSNFQGKSKDRDPVARAAHDLCNHLQVISSALNIIQRTAGAETVAALDMVFGGARASLDRAARLGRAIVDNRRVEPDEAEKISIIDRLDGLRPLILSTLGSNITVEQSASDGIPDVICDATALDDAILNIVMNACRAMPSGGQISISVGREQVTFEAPPCAVLRIADTGCGMSPEIASRAFEPRFTTREAGVGSGLGLTMVADFARGAGGSAELQSLPGIGTVVTIRLPGVLKRVRRSAAAD